MTFIKHAIHGEWHCGCGLWEGKPLLSASRAWHDGWQYVLHVGPLWVQVSY